MEIPECGQSQSKWTEWNTNTISLPQIMLFIWSENVCVCLTVRRRASALEKSWLADKSPAQECIGVQQIVQTDAKQCLKAGPAAWESRLSLQSTQKILIGEEKIFKTKLKAVQFFCLLSFISHSCVNSFCFYLENQGLSLGLFGHVLLSWTRCYSCWEH